MRAINVYNGTTLIGIYISKHDDLLSSDTDLHPIWSLWLDPSPTLSGRGRPSSSHVTSMKQSSSFQLFNNIVTLLMFK